MHNCMVAMGSRALNDAPNVGNEGLEIEPGNERVENERECGRSQPWSSFRTPIAALTAPIL